MCDDVGELTLRKIEQREKYMDGIVRTVGDGSKTVQVLQMTRGGERWRLNTKEALSLSCKCYVSV